LVGLAAGSTTGDSFSVTVAEDAGVCFFALLTVVGCYFSTGCFFGGISFLLVFLLVVVAWDCCWVAVTDCLFVAFSNFSMGCFLEGVGFLLC
jgi:hypothetical protein